MSFSSVAGTFSVITMKPGPLISAVIPAGSDTKRPTIPAGSTIEIRGARLSTGGAKTAQAPFPTSLGGTEVRVDDKPIPLKSVADAQISAQLPSGVAGFVQLKVTTAEGTHAMNMFVDAAAASSPQITQAGIRNGASFLSGAVAPGEMITIFGTGLGPAQPVPLQLTANGQHVTTSLGGTRVLFDGAAAPLIYTSANQVSVIAPYSIGQRPTTEMQVEYNGTGGNKTALPAATAAPGTFTVGSTGSGQGAILNQDYSVNGPSNAVAAK